ncbi:type VI immunity family protein [Paracoccus sp. (in: a-proteobacteria)]|uniref:type VI immunity family protein n=1 Tax=Paracoccus sp. TaxID=267 RepID=UPI0035B2A233
MDEAPRLYPDGGGVVIRAGTYPQLGDQNIGGVPNCYRIVNAALRPWLFTDYANKPTRLIKLPRPLNALDETLGCITRFDDGG